jgi:hypothetical protein
MNSLLQAVDPDVLVRALLLSVADTDSDEIANRQAQQIFLSCHERPELLARLATEAEYHGVASLIAPRISAVAKALPEIIPEGMRRVFIALAHRHERAARARERSLDQLLTAVASASIPLILLKGAALSHLIYPSPRMRPMTDIDVLIDPVDLKRTVEVVCDLGYHFAPHHVSRFAGHMHHLPAATMTNSGFRITLEIHVDAMSPDVPERLNFANLSARPTRFRRGPGPDGFAFGHTDMLRHMARHTFEPTRRVRLMHLNDLWRYGKIFADEIDWDKLTKCYPQAVVALRLVSTFFAGSPLTNRCEKMPHGAGLGMAPLSEIANLPFKAKPAALFNPSAWWLHGYYGIAPEDSLLFCRTIRHPLTLVRWLARRVTAAILPPPPFGPL